MSPFLESLILQGLAMCDTWTFGTSGAGTLRIDKDTFIILTGFDYFHFVDEPPPAGTRAVLDAFITPEDATSPINFDLQFDNGEPGVPNNITFNPLDLPASQASLQSYLDTFFPGFIASIGFAPGPKIWEFAIFTTNPGIFYNGVSSITTLVEPGSVTEGTFAGGTVGTISLDDFLKCNIHQLELRNKGARHTWTIQEDLQAYGTGVFADATGADLAKWYVNVTGKYQKKDLFIPFTEDIQIGIIKVPPTNVWTVDYAPLDLKANEPKLPGGYGMTGIANLNVVKSVLFDSNLEQYFPVTINRTSAGKLNYREQFKVDYANSNGFNRGLNNPKALLTFVNKGAGRRYPVINFDFVRVNMNYKEFQQRLEQWTTKLGR